MRRNRFALDLEIKPTPGSEAHTGAVVAAEVARLWHGDALMPLLSSFSREALQAAQSSAPQLRRALLIDSLRPDAMDAARQLACVALITNHKLMDRPLLERIHGAGLRALVYTVNDREKARALIDIGIDGIVTDAVDRFTPDALPG